MCGIAGAVVLSDSARYSPQVLGEIVSTMSDRMIHRGPDGSGLWVDQSAAVALGHRRLAIVDLSESGRQPMEYGQGRYRISFNGEIYNFRALKEELETRGCAFASTSDTEVLLAAIAEWGLHDALRRVVGMYAFSVWDSQERVLHLARDRTGEKPLHVHQHNGYVFFASELRAFPCIPDFRGELGDDAVRSYFKYGYVPEPLSIYEGVWKVPPGTSLTIRASQNQSLSTHMLDWLDPAAPSPSGALRPTAYWSCRGVADAGIADAITDEQSASREFESLLRRSVRDQMICDVPVGAFLSGGVDSSLVSAVMQSESSSPIHTFTVAFDNPSFDESTHARAVASHLGTIHEEFLLSEREVLDSVPSLASILDEPTANASVLPVHLISRFARTRVKVILSGDGGDELFGGYNRYRLTPRVWQKIKYLPSPLRRMLHRFMQRRELGSTGGVMGLVLSRLSLGSQVMGSAALSKLALLLEADNLRECYDLISSCWAHPEEIASRGAARPRSWCDRPPLEAMLLSDQLDYLPGDSLAKVDRAGMAASLETRLPLLDHRIVELSWRVPGTMKLHGNQSKALMRSVLYRFVPRQLIERPKMGFSVPVGDWLRGGLRDWADDLLRCDAFARRAPVDRDLVSNVWSRYLSGKSEHAYQIWALVSLAAWCHGQETEPASLEQRMVSRTGD